MNKLNQNAHIFLPRSKWLPNLMRDVWYIRMITHSQSHFHAFFAPPKKVADRPLIKAGVSSVFFNRVTSDLWKLPCTSTCQKFFFMGELRVLKAVHNWMIPCCICFGHQISENKWILQEELSLHIDFFPKNSPNFFLRRFCNAGNDA